ncbi:MAG: thioredoxin [Candidatus Levybacteria bacterium]|nr:thioredoxin [Candidatus Levybacteria bacterium]
MADITLTDANFEDEIVKSTVPALVDFWAPWCPPCKIIGPIVEELAVEYAGKLKVGKMDVDQHQIGSEKYGVMSLPTLLLFKDGKPVDSIIGAQSKELIKQKIEALISG